jgi:Gpi18-like mannosyltransferase
METGLPYWVWGFGNFDGVHYLNIAENGYNAQYTQAFFPLYPLFINLFTILNNYFLSGLVLTNVFFIIFLYVLFKLIRIDFSERTAKASIMFLLLFPTSFYFGAIYSESLFFLLTALAVYCVRKEKFYLAIIFTIFASATRILGIFLSLLIFIEILKYLQDKKISFLSYKGIMTLLPALFSPIGLLVYMYYLYINFSDPLYFLHAQPAFGASRSDKPFILLPQVFIRYIRIFATVPFNTWPFINALSEFIFTLLGFLVILWRLKKIRFSYLLFGLGCFLLPTLTGTFSSMPRYVLSLFLFIPYIVEALPQRVLNVVYIIFVLAQFILLSMFIRGYWVA